MALNERFGPPNASLRKKIKASVQLIEDNLGYHLISNKSQKILTAPAYQWLSQLP